MNCLVENIGIGEGLMGEIVSLEIMPNDLDIIEFRCIFRQPFGGEPVGALGESCQGRLARMDRAVVEHDDSRRALRTGLGAIAMIEGLEMGDEIGAAFGCRGGNDQLALLPVKRAHHCNLLRLPRSRHPQVGAALGPGVGEIGMGERLALVGEQKHNVTRFGLPFAQLEPKPHPLNGIWVLPSLQRVPRPPPAEPPFLRSVLESCDREMVTPSRRVISSARRAKVQFGRSATGAESSGSATLIAASALNATGPGATLALSASIPPLMKSLRHSRTVSWRTPKASAIRALVQPDSVNRMARARSASARSAPPAIALRAPLCSSDAITGDLPAMHRPPNQTNTRNHNEHLLATPDKPA